MSILVVVIMSAIAELIWYACVCAVLIVAGVSEDFNHPARFLIEFLMHPITLFATYVIIFCTNWFTWGHMYLLTTNGC